MRQFLKNIIVFSALALTGCALLIALWGTYMPQMLTPNVFYPIGYNGHLFSRIQDLEGRRDIDILILGSSHAYRGFDTRLFEAEGFTCFNLGSSGQTPINGQVLLERYLDQLNPKLVIYEVFPGSFNSDGVESSLDIIANDRNDLYSVEMALKINHLKTYNTLVVGMFKDLIKANADFKEVRQKKYDTYIEGGYVQKKADFFMKPGPDEREWDWKQKQFKAFGENLSMILDIGAEVVLVKAPVTKSLYRAFTDNEEYDIIMQGYGNYYNFNKLVDLTDSLHFYDAHHLNHAGVKLFNQRLLELLPLANYLDKSE